MSPAGHGVQEANAASDHGDHHQCHRDTGWLEQLAAAATGHAAMPGKQRCRCFGRRPRCPLQGVQPWDRGISLHSRPVHHVSRGEALSINNHTSVVLIGQENVSVCWQPDCLSCWNVDSASAGVTVPLRCSYVDRESPPRRACGGGGGGGGGGGAAWVPQPDLRKPDVMILEPMRGLSRHIPDWSTCMINLTDVRRDLPQARVALIGSLCDKRK